MQKANGTSVESPWLFSDPQDRTGEDRSSMACVFTRQPVLCGRQKPSLQLHRKQLFYGHGQVSDRFRTCENL